MKSLIPNQFLFRFAYSCPYDPRLPLDGQHILDLSPQTRLPFMGEMDGFPEFADIRCAWNEHGLGFQWQTMGKQESIYGDPNRPTACDSFSIWLDTRDTRSIHRGSRYCQRFLIMIDPGEKPHEPMIIQKPIKRATADAPMVDLTQIRLARLRSTMMEISS